MSDRRPQPALARLDEWLPAFDRDRLARLVGAEQVRRAAKRGVRPQEDPRPASALVVRANVAPDGGKIESTSVGLGPDGRLACRCSCGQSSRQACEHVVGLLAALAASPSLRRAIARDGDSGAAAEESDDPAPGPGVPADPATSAQDRGRAIALLRDQRVDAEALRRRRATGLLDRTFAAWRRRGELRPLGDVEFLLEIEPEDPVSVEPGPILHLRARPVAERRPFGPDDLESRRLPASEWRLFESLGRSASPADRHFVARGTAATTFLDRVREAGVALRDAKGVHAIGFAPWTLRAALRLREPRDEEVRNHPVVATLAEEAEDERRRVENARRRWAAERGPLSTEDFLRLAGLPPGAIDESGSGAPQVLEAIWLPIEQDGDGSERPARVPPIPFADTLVFAGPRSFAFWADGGVFAEVEPGTGAIALARLCEQPTVLVDAEDLPRLPALLREQFRGEGVSLPARTELGLPPLPVPHLALRVTGSAFSVRATLEARYGRRTIALLPDTLADPDDASRNADAERTALDLVLGTRLRPSAPRRGRGAARAAADAAALELSAEGDAAVEFWVRDLPRLVRLAGPGRALDEVSVPPAMRRVSARGQVRATLAANSTAGGAIEVALRFAAEGVPADVDAIREALLAKRRWVRLDDGSVAELSDRVAELAESAHDAFAKSESATLPRWAVGEIEAWSALADEARLEGEVASWTERLRALPAADPGPIAGLRAELRSYQRTGVAWLQWLADLGVGGILADDMGLGKTVQALALLAWRRERDGKAPSLVVAPTSVALNWIREAERFVPGLDALLLHGADRHERYEDVAGADLVVTTYALLRRDVERLRGISFRYVLLDEAQQIKNHAAATTAAAKSLRAGARLALTGTPIENRLLELWSILDFCNPGMLGGWRSFSRRWERPVLDAIEGGEPAGDEPGEADAPPTRAPGRPPAALAREETAALRARIRPFVLRRAKSEVQRDLPPKIESDVVVEMTPAQRRAYAALAANVRADLGPKIAGGGLDRNRMLVLTALLRLRQVACDPRLVDPRMDAEDSAKLLALRELVSEVVASGRRALVFSQFVELLTLLRSDLDERGIGYCYLDGRTRDRQKVIETFTEGDQPLFLLSLRAGGTGINLAAADVVIHLDPWWNPAVEEQATDRAHRIGQVRTVSVYRLIAAGTVEEAILRLKQRKRTIAGAVMDEGLGDLPRLDADEIEELFRFGE
ncbi:DEAD/DEAH box helicase [bacterium]|nr:DEAD/DEAH box helicase [bacterium]